jgi:hypothetical protein
MKQLLLAGLVLVTAACGAYAFPGGGPGPVPTTGTVTGKVVSVPCAPVERVDSPCPGRPVPGLEIDFVCGESSAVTKATTDANGDYSAHLTPGTCSVKFKTYMRYISGPQKVTVTVGDTVVANYVLDNGIRVAVPQQ